MSDLDDKLKAVIADQQYLDGDLNLSPEHVAKGIAAIKQAFSEAGYRLHLSENVVVINQKGVMTGQEWYERFVKELGEPQTFVGYGYDDTGYDDDHVLEAAKKAAGLET